MGDVLRYIEDWIFYLPGVVFIPMLGWIVVVLVWSGAGGSLTANRV